MWATRFLVCVMLALTSTQLAHAQSSDPALVEFNAGRSLSKEDRCAEAVPRFLASLQHERTVGALLNLGHCYEMLGQLAGAWRAFRDGAALAEPSDPRRTEAAARAEALARLVPTLTIFVAHPNDPPGIRVHHNGAEIPPAAWGSPLPVDPGVHVVVAEAPGRQSFSRTVTLARGERQSVRLELAREREVESSAAPAASRPASTPAMVYAAGIATVLGLGVGTGFGVVALGKREELGSLCPAYPLCDASQRERASALDASGRSAGLVSTVAFTAAGVALVAAVVLWLAAGHGDVF